MLTESGGGWELAVLSCAVVGWRLLCWGLDRVLAVLLMRSLRALQCRGLC